MTERHALHARVDGERLALRPRFDVTCDDLTDRRLVRTPCGRRDLASEPPFETLVFEGDSSPALIDVNDNEALRTLMDEEERDRGHS